MQIYLHNQKGNLSVCSYVSSFRGRVGVLVEDQCTTRSDLQDAAIILSPEQTLTELNSFAECRVRICYVK